MRAVFLCDINHSRDVANYFEEIYQIVQYNTWNSCTDYKGKKPRETTENELTDHEGENKMSHFK